MENIQAGFKRCGKCGQHLPLDAFGHRRAAPDGRQHWCRGCFAAWAAAHRPRTTKVAPPVGEGEKWCRACEQVKPVEAFPLHRTMPDGRQTYCRECFARRYRAKRAAEGKLTRPLDVPDGYKFCRTCQSSKPLSEFGLRRSRAGDGRMSACKDCRKVLSRAGHLKRHYDLTEAEVEAIREAQGGLCAICRVVPAVHVDHDHATGTVRGMLCFPCNAAIGHLRDDPQVVRQAVVYLEKARRAADQAWLQEVLDGDQTSPLERAFAAVLVGHQNAT